MSEWPPEWPQPRTGAEAQEFRAIDRARTPDTGPRQATEADVRAAELRAFGPDAPAITDSPAAAHAARDYYGTLASHRAAGTRVLEVFWDHPECPAPEAGL